MNEQEPAGVSEVKEAAGALQEEAAAAVEKQESVSFFSSLKQLVFGFENAAMEQEYTRYKSGEHWMRFASQHKGLL